MSINAFIKSDYRPEISGGKLDENHQTRFFYDHKFNSGIFDAIEVNAICIGPKKDVVLLEIEHALDETDNILVFYYEDIHSRWSYLLHQKDQLFIYRKNDEEQYYIRCKNLYIRGCSVSDDSKYWPVISNLLNFLEIWKGNLIHADRQRSANESKLFQINNSLRKSLQKYRKISLGRSHVIKGKIDEKFLNNNYIVKSLSAVRSQVADNYDYKTWCLNDIHNLPVLIQEKIDGNDMRVHIVDDLVNSKISTQKDKTDYRYSSNFSKLDDVEFVPAELIGFCREVSKYEKNRLLGIDFIKQNDDRYIVLEANPSPGWASYYSYKGITRGDFVIKILEMLKSA